MHLAYNCGVVYMHDKLHSVLSAYLHKLEADQLSAATKRTYASLVRRFLYFVEDEADFACDTTGDINCLALIPIARRFISESLDGTASSLNSRVVAIKHFFKVLGNVSESFERPRTRLTTLEPLSDEQLDRFVAAARSFCPRDRAVALLLAGTGMRLKEAVRLDLDSLIISEQCFAINLHRGGRCQQLVLEGEMLTALFEYLVANPEFAHSDRPRSDHPLFVDRVGKRLSMRGLTACVKKVGWHAKLSVTPAILRATRLSRLALETKDVLALANLAGFECRESAKRIIKACQKDITSFSVETDVEAFAAVAQPPVFLRVI